MDFDTLLFDAAQFFRVRICAGNQDIDVLNLCACETVCFADFAAVSDNDDLAGAAFYHLAVDDGFLEIGSGSSVLCGDAVDTENA